MLDPRTKFLAIVGLIAATFLTESFKYFGGIAMLFILVFIISKTPVRQFLRNVMFLSWLLIFTFVAHLWEDVPVFQQGGASTGLTTGLLVVGQLIVVVGWVSILGFSTSPLETISSLERLLRPLRLLHIPVHKLSIVAMLSIRFIPLLFEERQYLVRAYIARGIDLKQGNLIVRLKNYALVCVPLFNSMLRRVEHLTLAMESRAFQAQATRTTLHEFHMGCRDYLVLGGSIIVLLAQVVP